MAKGTSFWERLFGALDIFYGDEEKKRRRKKRDDEKKAKESYKKFERWYSGLPERTDFGRY